MDGVGSESIWIGDGTALARLSTSIALDLRWSDIRAHEIGG